MSFSVYLLSIKSNTYESENSQTRAFFTDSLVCKHEENNKPNKSNVLNNKSDQCTKGLTPAMALRDVLRC